MKITGPAVSALERSERDATIRVDTLRRAAEAMDCTFVYAFIPNQSLDETIRTHARQAARRQLAEVANTMALEDQAIVVGEDLIRAQTELLISKGRVWADGS